MAFAAALSQHPVPAEAVGEVVGAVLDALGPAPDLAVLFCSPAVAGAMEDVVGAVRATLAPAHLIGAAAATVVGGAVEVEEGPAIALWAGHTGPVTPIRIETAPVEGGLRVTGVPRVGAGQPRTMLVLADPFSLPFDALLASMAEDVPDLSVVGGLASAARGPGGNHLILDGDLHHDGAVGVLLPEGASPTSVVAQGCRPVGDPLIVTAVDDAPDGAGQVLLELGGQPAGRVLAEVATTLDDDLRTLLRLRAQIGVVVDESLPTFAMGDFLVRPVVGLDTESQGLVVGSRIPVGTTVQLHVPDPDAAAADLRRAFADASPPPDGGALVFTCIGRGTGFFGTPDVDAEAVVDAVGPAVAGMASAGEIGPLGGVNRVHTLSATAVVFP